MQAVSLWTKQGHLCFSLPIAIDITVHYGCLTKSWTNFFIFIFFIQFAFHLGNDKNLVDIPLISAWACCNPPLHFSVWNARSLNTKVLSLCNLLLSHHLDLLSVTESWLTLNDSITIANLINSLKDYTVYHLPRSTRRGGEFIITK